MTRLSRLTAQARVILAAAPTYLVGAATVIPFIAEQVGTLVPSGAAETIVRVAAWLVAACGVAVAIIRRVTPVLPTMRGVLPPWRR